MDASPAALADQRDPQEVHAFGISVDGVCAYWLSLAEVVGEPSAVLRSRLVGDGDTGLPVDCEEDDVISLGQSPLGLDGHSGLAAFPGADGLDAERVAAYAGDRPAHESERGNDDCHEQREYDQ